MIDPPAMTRRAHLYTFLAALCACIVALLWMVGPYLLSLYLGGTLAMLAFPVYRRLRTRGWGPRLAAGTLTPALVLLVITPLTILAVMAVAQGIEIGQAMSELKEFSPRALTKALSRWELVRTLIGDPADVNARLKALIQAAGHFTAASVLTLGKGAPEFLVQVVLAVTSFFFLLLNGERFMEWLLGLGALDRATQEELVESFRDTTISVVLAGLAAASAQAVLILLGFLLLGVPGAFLAAALTFVFAWIPLLGTMPAAAAGLAYLYVEGSPAAMCAMAGVGIAAGLVDNLIRPLVLRGRAGMHPLVGFVAILSGIRLFGILGVFIGPILAAMALALLRIWPVVRGRFGMTLDSKETTA
ncbi:MAG: AI-2E family transporter [Elusimicrobiota bacterium]|nr:MAG: AI-2E family transporter [Elusimicrobiota bacterium]